MHPDRHIRDLRNSDCVLKWRTAHRIIPAHPLPAADASVIPPFAVSRKEHPTLCLGMAFIIDAFEVLTHQLRVQLGGRDIAMSHHLLNGMQIRTVFQKMYCKAVP